MTSSSVRKKRFLGNNSKEKIIKNLWINEIDRTFKYASFRTKSIILAYSDRLIFNFLTFCRQNESCREFKTEYHDLFLMPQFGLNKVLQSFFVLERKRESWWVWRGARAQSEEGECFVCLAINLPPSEGSLVRFLVYAFLFYTRIFLNWL